MKLNFWQWLAVALLIIGCAVWLFERTHPGATPVMPAPRISPSTQTAPVP